MDEGILCYYRIAKRSEIVTILAWSRIHERTISFSDLRFLYTMFTLQTSFKPLLLTGGGGGDSAVLYFFPI
jgi:hypothetical protein